MLVPEQNRGFFERRGDQTVSIGYESSSYRLLEVYLIVERHFYCNGYNVSGLFPKQIKKSIGA